MALGRLVRITVIVTIGPLLVAAVAPAQTGTFLDRRQPGDLRLASYNVNWDSIFPDNDPNNHGFRSFNTVVEFRRIIAALDPDVMCLQEINSARNAQDAADIFDAAIPLGGGSGWQAAIGYSNVIVSRYPLTMKQSVTIPPGDRAQSMALVDLPNATFDRDLYIINEHYKCCGGASNEAKRQEQSDALVNWMRDCRTPGGWINLASGTPMVIMGDLNLVDGPGPLTTLVVGDIFDEATFGSDSPPDWDGTDSTDAHPLHNVGGPADYTWRNDGGGFAPGRLDVAVFTDSVVTQVHEFVLNTTTMSAGDLAVTGLLANDVVLDPPGRFDHLPVVVDLRFPAVVQPDGDVSLDGRTDGIDIDWFVDLALAGAGGDPLRIAHGDYNGNGVIDSMDVPSFTVDLLGF